MKYYHLTPIENRKSISDNGLKANEGAIFLFTDKSVAGYIALDQIGLMSYSLFEVNPKGFTVEPIPDNVVEYTAQYQRILMQDLVEPKHLRFINNYNIQIPVGKASPEKK